MRITTCWILRSSSGVGGPAARGAVTVEAGERRPPATRHPRRAGAEDGRAAQELAPVDLSSSPRDDDATRVAPGRCRVIVWHVGAGDRGAAPAAGGRRVVEPAERRPDADRGPSAATCGHGPIDAIVDLARRVADDDFVVVWLPHIFGVDALNAVGLVWREVGRIELGTVVVPTYPRHPVVMAQQALTTQAAIHGRSGARHRPVAPARTSRACTATRSTAGAAPARVPRGAGAAGAGRAGVVRR